ncbi:MAG: MMPL family transporter, partial [Nocardioides sp.]|nr:MMPL family transporter [Nocardioides sp.]
MDFRRMGVRAVAAVMLGWLAVIAGVNLAVPQLESVIADSSTPFVPREAGSMQAFAQMDRAFGTHGSKSTVFVVAERKGGLTSADRRYLGDLAPRLGRSRDVSYVQDVRGNAELLDSLTSKDRKAAYVQVGMPGDVGAPASIAQLQRVRALVGEQRPAGLTVQVTGPAATIADMAVALDRSMVRVTIVTVGLIAVILLVLYRSVPVVGVVLGFIGLALAAGRGAVAVAGTLGLFQVSTFTVSFLTAVLLGAATDYAVFLVSRYQELRREGVEHREAVTLAARRVGSVVVGSALTVVVATSTMLLAHIGFFTTTGPAVALSVAVALVMSLTLLPVVILVVGSRGWLDPRPRRAGRTGWAEWASAATLAKPGRALVAGLLPLLVLAAFVTAFRPSYDDRTMQPADSESNQGYRTLARHFPANLVLSEYVVIHTDHDLRDPQDLAALEQAAGSVARVPGIESVRTITRPLGTPLAQASVSYQAGQVGDRLGSANARLAGGSRSAAALADGAGRLKDGTTRLADGSAALAGGAGQLADGAGKAQQGAGTLVAGSKQLQAGIRSLARGAGDAHAGAVRLHDGAAQLATSLQSGHRDAQRAVAGLAQVQQALRQSPTCGLDPYCRQARDGLDQIYAAERDQLVPGMGKAADGARSLAGGADDLAAGLDRLDSGLVTARSGAGRVVSGQELMRQQLARLTGGA